ncbi:MAG: hypothetical protein ACERKZ_17555 [Lachnotalea sp.]
MKDSIRFVKSEIYRAMLSRRFVISVLCMMMVCFISIHDTIQNLISYGNKFDDSIVSVIKTMIGFDRFKVLIVVLSAIIYTDSYCSDFQTHYINLVYSRIGVRAYAICKCMVNFIISMFSILLSLGGFALILRTQIPLVIMDDMNESMYAPYYDMIQSHYAIWYLIMLIFTFALAISFLNILGLLFSTFFNNKYVAFSVPFICFYLLSTLTFYLPDSLYFLGFVSFNIEISDNMFINILYNTTFLLGLYFLIGYQFTKQIIKLNK